MLDLKSIVCAGFGCIMHLQAMAEEVIFFCKESFPQKSSSFCYRLQ